MNSSSKIISSNHGSSKMDSTLKDYIGGYVKGPVVQSEKMSKSNGSTILPGLKQFNYFYSRSSFSQVDENDARQSMDEIEHAVSYADKIEPSNRFEKSNFRPVKVAS